ncbi:Swt1 family HEPN domain-containing protein [Clostridium estertheticum]|uniref:Swt1 family HEPN domain-containing protein n=1 Tax=Clostridium estertheticum TaxID=238834 RepID=UPI001CF5C742|nr:Swt1 family HEPN domain-containing protein [Clostridium estertheticum]MCB2343301.1 hypothetical protein [Clostridium estertheticum]
MQIKPLLAKGGGADLQLQNSYIFISNPYKKKEAPKGKKDGVIYVGHSFISYLKRAFPAVVKVPEHRNFFKSEYNYTVEFDGNNIEARFIIHEVVKKYYLDVVVTGKSNAQIIKGLEYIQAAIEKSDILKDYIEIISYDAISEYYCNKIYPKLNELERNLRKILFNIYVVNFGRDYYQMTISGDLQKKIKSVIQAKGNEERRETERLQKFFYSMEFADIKQMLFVPHWTEGDERSKDVFLKSHEDLSKLTDDELRKAFSEIAPRSDWERFFSDKMDDDDFQSLIDEIRRSRNSIAHCKFFYHAEYARCNKAMSKFNKAVKSAIAITEDKDFSEKNSESIKEALASVSKRFEEYKKSMAEALSPIIQISQQYSEMMVPIKEGMIKNISRMLETIQPTLQSLSGLKASIPLSNLSTEVLQTPKEGNDENGADEEDCQSNESENDSNI